MVTRNDSRHERNLRPPQKGLPRFRYQSIEAEVADASTSIRRWWWEYLRLSKAYWLVCRMSHNMQTPRTKDEGLATLYRAFGNVHRYSFEDWWRRIGSDLFKEPESSPRVIEINQDLSNYSANRENRLLIEIPIKLSRRTIQRQIGRILTQYENQRPRNRLELAVNGGQEARKSGG